MGGFGAFWPLPFRLGGDAETGWTAAQFSRLAADLLAVGRVRKLGVLTYMQGTTAPTLMAYRGVNGVGLAHAPVVSASPSAGINTITFPASYEDPRGVAQRVSVLSARASVYRSGTTTPRVVEALADGGRTVSIEATTTAGAPVNVTLTVSVFGTLGEDRLLEDYGGFPDKEDAAEEDVSYAWVWYMEYEGMLGSAFTTNRTGLVHAMKLAKARLRGAGIQRAIERFAHNCVPGTASDLLPVWAKICNVQEGPGTPSYETRIDCAARMMLVAGSSRAQLDAAVEAVLGSTLVAVHRNDSNDLSDPPESTIWPGGSDTGDPNYSLCDYQFSSARAHVWVEVTWPQGLTTTQFHHLMDVRLFRLLDVALPAHATTGWALSSGFILGESLLGYDAL